LRLNCGAPKLTGVPDNFLMNNSGSQNKSEGHRQKSMRKITNKDPYPLKVRFNCKCSKCGTHLGRGVNAYYWPATRTVTCLDCGHDDFQAFLSSVADEEVYNGTGNPYFS